MGACERPIAEPAANAITVGKIFRRYADRISWASPDQWKVVRAVSRCRTAALGGRKEVCDKCGEEQFLYNSCRNRHCPQCQGTARAKWVRERVKELLPVPYFHIVFTVPSELRPLALRNKRVLYGILFRSASETLLEVSERRLGAMVGVLAILHTWGQKLIDHPHLHCLVTGGGISTNGSRWIEKRQDYFLPGEILMKVFQGKFLDYLEEAYEAGRLMFPGEIAGLEDGDEFRRILKQVARKRWNVKVKKPFGGPEKVLCYLGRYTHRVAISNGRIKSCEDDVVTFSYKDYAGDGTEKTTSLPVTEFMRRFLLHVLPRGFKKIRGYGLLGNCVKRKKIGRARELIAEQYPDRAAEMIRAPGLPAMPEPRPTCPKCGEDALRVVGLVAPLRLSNQKPEGRDTS